MAKWTLPEKPRTDELEERVKRLEAKLESAYDVMEREIARIQQIQKDFPKPHKVGLFYVEMEYESLLREMKEA